MTTEEHKLALERFIEENSRFFLLSASIDSSLESAVYAMNELHLWQDAEGLCVEDVIKAWELVEILKYKKFPEQLRM